MFRKIKKEQLRVPAHIDYLAELRDFISEIGKKHRLSESMIKPFKLAIDEAATNIIRHAYRNSAEDGTITLRMIIRKENVTVCVIDKGKRFDPRNVKEPDLNRYVEIGKRGGLGIFIIRKLMDDIEYRTTSEGNELRLTKNREAISRSRISRFIPGGFKAVTLGMKTRFWAKTSLFLALVFGGYYAVVFFATPDKVFNEQLPTWSIMTSQVTKALVEDKTILEDLTGSRVNQLLNSLISKGRDEIFEIALVDSANRIKGNSELDKTFTKYDFAPLNDGKKISDFLYAYHIADDSTQKAFAIYDFSSPVDVNHPNEGKLTLHLRVYKQHIDALISAERWQAGQNALIFLGVSFAGSFLLIYLLVNPFRKLTEFVRTGGDVAMQDDIEIDPSSEVGEIAKAFSDITAKFRESQKNLAEQERLQQEMQVAKEIQQTLLPHDFPDLEGYEISGHYESAELVGGDYYDFVEVDRDTLGIVVADVSGKGVPGSMVMTMIRQALRTESRGVKNAAEVLSRLNDLVVGDMRKGMFVTIFYVIIDSKKRRLNFASAGHNPMILYRGSTNKTYYLNPRGFPIGIELPDKDLFRESIESDTIQLVEDDLVLLYTDGITEAMDDNRELFGEERLLDTVRGCGNFHANPFAEKLSEAIQSFTRGHPQSDDITYVTVCEKTTLRKEEFRRAKEAYRLIMAGTSIRIACENAGISTFAYYNKYKKSFEDEGIESFEVDENDSLEARHIAIEDKAKIFDIIKNHPEYGPKRISDELNTEKYAYTDIPENKIYDELVRNRLNTRQLREAFVARGGNQKRRRAFKTPGTPMLTLDGRVLKRDDQGLPHGHIEMQPTNGHESRLPAKPSERDIDRSKPTKEKESSTDSEPENTMGYEILDEGSSVDASDSKDEIEITSSQQDHAEPKEKQQGVFAFDDLLDEEISKTFSESTSFVEEPEADDAKEKQIEVDSTHQDFEREELFEKSFDESEVFIAGIDELLNEDALDTTTVSIDGEIDVQTQVETIMKAPDLNMLEGQETETRDHEEEIESSPSSERPPAAGMSGKKSLLFREQQMTKGYRFYKAQQFEEAIKEFEKVVADFPGYKKAYKILANAYYRVERYDDAIRTYRIVKAKDPDDVAAYENLGIAYIKQGKVEEAMKEWQSLLQIAPYRQDIEQKLTLLREKVAQSSEK
ncbi:MAG: SpoIIE family protein phosphatase [bacterium]